MLNRAHKIISLLLVFVLLLAIFPLNALAQSVTNSQIQLSNNLVNSNTSLEYQFQVGQDHIVGDLVTVQLPVGFVIPSTIPASSVKLLVDGNEVIGGVSDVLVNGQELNFILNTNITMGSIVDLDILVIAGVTTPSNAGNYTTQLSTSKHNIPVNLSIPVQSQISQPMVSVYSAHINKNASYKIVFITGNTDMSVLSGQNSDTISINFPAGTTLPNSIAGSNVKINGEAVTGTIGINKLSGNNSLTIPIPTNLTIPKNSFIELDILQAAGIINPSLANTNYSLQVWTSKDQRIVNSASYTILESIITVPEVTVSPNVVGTAGAYFVKFRTSSEGNLNANTDYIYLEFPLGTTLPASIAANRILVNNVALTASPTIIGNQLRITAPINIAAGQEVNIQIKPEANIVHPVTEGKYSIKVWTSQDTVKNSSIEYQVANAVKGLTTWVSPDIVGQAGQYIIALENGTKTLEINDTITIQFPEGTSLTNTNIRQYIFIDGKQFQGGVAVNQQERTITLTLTEQIISSQMVNILFTQNAGIKNPMKSGSYSLKVKTSKDIAYQTSNSYLIQGNHITNLTTQITNNSIGTYGDYLVQFSVSSTGGLLGGLDKVTLIFPADTVLPSTISRSLILVNDKPLDSDVYINQANRSLQITIPSTINILQGGSVKINIPSTANIKNPTSVGNYNLTVYTSRDPVAVDSTGYVIGKQITAPTVTISPNKYLESGQYTIGFYVSDQGGLSNSIGDFIEVRFPTGTTVPASIAASNIMINGKQPSSVQVTQQTVRILLPTNMSITNGSYVGVVINANAGIKNPVAGSYQLFVGTSQDKSMVPSNSYSTVGTSTSDPNNPGTNTPTQGKLTVELSSQAANSLTDYTIKFQTSNKGALKGGTDEITINFDTRVVLPNYISRESIKVNGLAVNSGWVRKNGQSIIFSIPTTLNIGNSEWVTITIDHMAEIKNPSVEGTYSIYVSSTKDTTPAQASYVISGSSDRLTVSPQYNSNKQIVKYTIVYKTGTSEYLKGGFDYITITLPAAQTLDQIRDNLVLKVNGYNVDSDLILVSGKNLAFLLPTNVNINSNSKLVITLEDSNHIIAPNEAGTFVFFIATSKNTTMTSSNEIQTYLYTSSNQTDNGNNTSNPNDGTDNPNNDGSTEIKLTLNSKDALVNGKLGKLDTAPKIINGTTMVPLRFITEGLGGRVDYRSDTKRIIMIYNDEYLIFTIDSNSVYTKDDVIKLPVAPTIENGVTLVPLRFISEWMDIYTYYNSSDKTILLNK